MTCLGTQGVVVQFLQLKQFISVLVCYASISIGFIPLFAGMMALWSTPSLIGKFLVAGWQGAVTQVVAIATSVLVYYPFVKALDNQYRKEESVEK